MLSWAAWFKFLFNKVIANTCLFTLTSFSKQSASWKVLEICELCALSTVSQKTYSLNTLVAAATASTGGDNPLGGGGGWGGKYRKRPNITYNSLFDIESTKSFLTIATVISGEILNGRGLASHKCLRRPHFLETNLSCRRFCYMCVYVSFWNTATFFSITQKFDVRWCALWVITSSLAYFYHA